jgi:hypothetical protein
MIPAEVTRAMVIAAQACVEACPLYADQGEVGLYAKHEPSEELRAAFSRERASVIGSFIWAIPTIGGSRDGKGFVFLSWAPAYFIGGRN